MAEVSALCSPSCKHEQIISIRYTTCMRCAHILDSCLPVSASSIYLSLLSSCGKQYSIVQWQTILYSSALLHQLCAQHAKNAEYKTVQLNASVQSCFFFFFKLRASQITQRETWQQSKKTRLCGERINLILISSPSVSLLKQFRRILQWPPLQLW